MSDEFRVVKSKRHKRSKDRYVNQKYSPTTVDRLCQEISIPRITEKITDARDHLTSTEFYSCVKDLVQQVFQSVGNVGDTESDQSRLRSEVICYGLGNFSECVIARYQLGLLMALRENLQIPSADCHLYDPKFMDCEVDILKNFGFGLIDRNEEGKHRCDVATRTVFYMPHCGKSLCNNLLWANWDRQCLSTMVVIGNSLSTIINNTPSRILSKTCHYIQKIHPYCTKVPLPSTFQYTDIFNDTAIHSFPSEKLQSAPIELWENPAEPQYEDDDAEFISNKELT